MIADELDVQELVVQEQKMVEDLGDENVEYVEAPDGVHDFLVFLWHEPERTATLCQLASWIGAQTECPETP